MKEAKSKYNIREILLQGVNVISEVLPSDDNDYVMLKNPRRVVISGQSAVTFMPLNILSPVPIDILKVHKMQIVDLGEPDPNVALEYVKLVGLRRYDS